MLRVCNLWSSADVQWNNSDWTWDDCQLVQDLLECLKWGSAAVTWGTTDNQWITGCPTPPVTSSVAPLGVDATTLIQPWLEEPWNPYKAGQETKKKKLVELICRVKGQRFDEKKYAKEAKITVGDIRLVVKQVANIDLDIRVVKNDTLHSIHGSE